MIIKFENDAIRLILQRQQIQTNFGKKNIKTLISEKETELKKLKEAEEENNDFGDQFDDIQPEIKRLEQEVKEDNFILTAIRYD